MGWMPWDNAPGRGQWWAPADVALVTMSLGEGSLARGEKGSLDGRGAVLARSNTLKVVHFNACVKEEIANLQVLSHINQSGCLTGARSGFRQLKTYWEYIIRAFILSDLWEGNARLLMLVWGDCQMCQVLGKVLKRSLWLVRWRKPKAFWRTDLRLK